MKYKNRSSTCLLKHIHQSRFEAEVCNSLLADKQNKKIVNFECQKKFELRVNKILICNHYVDFYIQHAGGKYTVLEAKGFQTDVWQIKRKLFEAIYPKIKYEIRYARKQ